MKTEGQIRQKLKQVVYRHRKSFIHRGLACRPENCEHNAITRLPLHVSDRAYVRTCRYSGEDWDSRICDPLLGGDRQASECPHYACRNTVESLKTSFREELEQQPLSLAKIAREYPDVAALLWALDEIPTGLWDEDEDNA